MSDIAAVHDSQIVAYLDTLDATANFDQLAAELVAVAAERGFTIRVNPGLQSIAIDKQVASNGSSKILAYSGRLLTPEVLLDLITFFENSDDPEELMNIYSTDLFKYLAGDMIGQSTITLTIASVTLEKMNSGRGGEQTKPCVHFQERDKMMVLNKSNAAAIAKELGGETDHWKGAKITLNAPMIEAFGKQSRSIRVIKVEPPDVPAKPRDGNGNGRVAQATQQAEPALG